MCLPALQLTHPALFGSLSFSMALGGGIDTE
jgi:hypothetical protein